jgi:hypothetical protein
LSIVIFSGVNNLFCLTPTSIYVNEIKFDYDGSGYANDALTVRDANGNPAIVPEMKYYAWSNKVAYIMGQSNRTIAVNFATNCPNSNLIVSLETIKGEGIGVVSNYTISNYTPGSYVYIPLNGTLPNNIGEHYCWWKFTISLTPNVPGYSSCVNYHYYTVIYYTTFAAPVSPMNEPWLSVLDNACDWANGKTTEYDIVTSITQGAYTYNFAKKKTYYGGNSHTSGTAFNCKGFLNESYADCQDMASVVQVYTNALGCNTVGIERVNGPFYYKYILPIGTTVWIDGTEHTPRWGWNFHQVGWLNEKVFDACIKIKQSSPRIPTDEVIEGTYKTDLLFSGTYSPIDKPRISFVY